MAFKPINKLFRPWITSRDQNHVKSFDDLYTCLGVSGQQIVPQVIYTCDRNVNLSEGSAFGSRDCWTRHSGCDSSGNSFDLIDFLMRSTVRAPVQCSGQESQTTQMAMSYPKERPNDVIDDNSNKIWFSKLKRQRPKRFNCPHCQIAFSNNGQLMGHIRTHTGIDTFISPHYATLHSFLNCQSSLMKYFFN